MSDFASYFNPEFSLDTYSSKDALSFASLCALAYQRDIENLDDGTIPEGWGFTNFKFFSKTLGGSIDTQGFVAECQDNIIISFRGSESSHDWATNFKLVTDPGPFANSEVHEGFQDALFPVLINILSAIYKFDPNRKKNIWVTGHSLGGALAILLVTMFTVDKIRVQGLYTFGAPRVGNKMFAELFDEEFKGSAFLVMNEGDLVPHLPDALRFTHVSKRMLFKLSGDRVEDQNTWDELKEKAKPIQENLASSGQNLMDFMSALISHMGKPGIAAIQYHLLDSPEGYLAKLKNDLK